MLPIKLCSSIQLQASSQARDVTCDTTWALILHVATARGGLVQLSCLQGISTIVTEFLPQNNPEKGRDNSPIFRQGSR